jgi:hypothetical protein
MKLSIGALCVVTSALYTVGSFPPIVGETVRTIDRYECDAAPGRFEPTDEASDRGLIGSTRRWGLLRQDDEGKQPFAPTGI